MAELEAAIASVTRALGRARDEAVELLVCERAALRGELRCLTASEDAKVVELRSPKRTST